MPDSWRIDIPSPQSPVRKPHSSSLGHEVGGGRGVWTRIESLGALRTPGKLSAESGGVASQLLRRSEEPWLDQRDIPASP